MAFSPVGTWFRGLLSLLLLGLAGYLLYRWADDLPRERVVEVRHGEEVVAERQPLTGFGERLSAWRPGWDRATAFLAGGLGLLLFTFAGRFVASPRLWLRSGSDEPKPERGGERREIRRPDGTVLHVELYGPADAPPIVLTHGWGANGTEWYYLKRDLGRRFRLIVWDLPGLGNSTQPTDRNFGIDKMARDLDAVLDLAGGRPAVLLGHSIGGMIGLTFCRLFPESLGTRVAGLVLVHTSYTNPARTKWPTAVYSALQKPVLEPLCWLTVGLSPLVRVMNYLSYLNGSAHWSNHRQMFAGRETRGQLEFVTRFMLQAPPAVVARGTLGMFGYDATTVLPSITVPVLVVGADRDETTIPEASRRIAADVPGAELVELSPAKHMGLIEQYGEFSGLVGRFCERVAAVPAHSA